jgi:endonuclease/exonuclease/phosphatase family metal-dependent hydrolase
MSVRRWSVTTWNVHGSEGPPVDRLAVAIAGQSPDVVAVQEIRHAQAKALAKALGMRLHWSQKHYPYSPLMYWKAEGLAILTPHRLASTDDAELTLSESRSSYMRRIVQWGDVERDGAALRLYNTHLSSENAIYERRAEAARLAHLVRTHRIAGTFAIAGDFNDDTDVAVIAAMPGIEHLPAPYTNPSEAPTQALDHVLLPPDAVDVSMSIPAGGAEWAELSDHLPLTVRFGHG